MYVHRAVHRGANLESAPTGLFLCYSVSRALGIHCKHIHTDTVYFCTSVGLIHAHLELCRFFITCLLCLRVDNFLANVRRGGAG